MDDDHTPDQHHTPMTARWYTVREAIQVWPLSRDVIYDAIARGELRAARLGVGRRKLVLRGAWIDAYLEARATPVEILRRRA